MVIQDLDRRRDRQAVARGACAQPRLFRHLGVAMMTRGERIEAIAEGLLQHPRHRVRLRLAHDQAGLAAPERQQRRGVRADFVPRDERLPFFGAPASRGEQPAEMRVALAILGEQDDASREARRSP